MFAELLAKRAGGAVEVTTESHNKLPSGTSLVESNYYGCGYGNYGRLSQGDQVTSGAFIRGKARSPLELSCLALGAAHVLGLALDGTVFSWGKCHFGQLGHSHMDVDCFTPFKISALEGESVVHVAAGESTSFAITEEGKCFAWGCGYYGALGLGSEQAYAVPQHVQSLHARRVVQVAAGAFHAIVRCADGDVLAFGRNEDGQLGLGDTLNRRSPEVVSALAEQTIIRAEAGQAHSVCILENNSAMGWGRNAEGQLQCAGQAGYCTPEHLSDVPDVAAAALGNVHTVLLTCAGAVLVLGNGDNTPTTVELCPPPSGQVVEVAAGETHCLALTDAGEVYTWGTGDFGKLGQQLCGWRQAGLVPPVGGEAVHVHGGSNHSFILCSPP